MKNITFLLFFISYFLHSQTTYQTVESVSLQQTRELKIQFPPNYDENTEKSYPIILVLDGDYLFEPVAGNVRLYSYWEEMPESIVVGINQSGFRAMDTSYSKETHFPTKEGTAFYDFLKFELMPHLRQKYRTTGFSIIVGHGRTANFMNYFLIKDPTFFSAYISISPSYSPEMKDRIAHKLAGAERGIWYYLATGTKDFPMIKKDVLSLKERLDSLQNDQLHLYTDNFKGKNHFSTVGVAIPSALSNIFSTYGPIKPKECTEEALLDISYCDYLIDKYKTIQELYGLDLKIRVRDFMMIADAIEKRQHWEGYEKLSKIAAKNAPETMLDEYFDARYYEETGKPKKALQRYESAYPQKEISYLTKDLIWNRITKLKKDLGY